MVNKITKRFHPKISIIIVTYNAANTLQACLDSVYKQAYSNLEIIIMDGKSEDGTVRILEENSHQIAYWMSEPDTGIYDAMNKAFKHVSGKWVCFIGADDELYSDFSAMAIELNSFNTIYYGNVIHKGIKCSGYLSPYYMAKKGMPHQAMFYPISVFEKHKFNLDYKISADSVLNMECWKDKNIKFEYKEYTVALFNHTGISGTNRDKLLETNMSNLILKNFGIAIWLRYNFRVLKGKIKEVF